MYTYIYDEETGGILLTDNLSSNSKEPRPVYSRELDILGFQEFWNYERQDKSPYLWAEANYYWYRGIRVAHTSGGSLYEKPTIVIEKDEQGNDLLPSGSTLLHVDMSRMIEKNRDMVAVIEKTTTKKIYDVYQRYKNKLDCFHVAFSGGKDSIVLLELVKRALPHTAFMVVFGDTGMEFPDTYDVVDIVERQCKEEGIAFYRAQSHFKPEESWKLFGPPSRILRWCCSVHKSAPQTLKIRELIGKSDYTGLAFVGVRAHESLSRFNQLTQKSVNEQSDDESDYIDSYEKVKGKKTAKSIYEWTSAEIWLYMFCNNLTINEAYKKGNARIGCLFCPMEGTRADFIQNYNYPKEVSRFTKIISASNGRTEISDMDYLCREGWNARKNGRFLKNNIDKYQETVVNNFLEIKISSPTTNWKEWIKTIGALSQVTQNEYNLNYNSQNVKIVTENNDNGYIVKIDNGILNFYPLLGKLIKTIFRKSAYCLQCRVCMSNCPFGCILFNNDISIDNCKHCHKCHDISNGCLVYDSLKIPIEEKINMITINCYSNHAPKTEWLTKFFKNEDYLSGLGGPQKTKFKRFLKDAGLIIGDKNTELVTIANQLGWTNETSLSLMLVNLALTPQFKWYIKNMSVDKNYLRNEIEQKLEEIGQSEGNISSIITSFKRISELPFGLKLHFARVTNLTPKQETLTRTKTTLSDPKVVLYALYKFAEACDKYYEFTLSRLMDFEIESEGVSPAEIFGFSREEMEQFLHGLARSNPDFISFTTTHDLEVVRLSEDKTSNDVLNLF